MFAAALALAAAASWGVGDFLGGLKSRSLRPVAILIVAQPIGAALLGIWVAIRGQGPPGSEVLWACVASIFGTVGLIAFYRGMAAGAGARGPSERLPGDRFRGRPRGGRPGFIRTRARRRSLCRRSRLGADRDGR